MWLPIIFKLLQLKNLSANLAKKLCIHKAGRMQI